MSKLVSIVGNTGRSIEYIWVLPCGHPLEELCENTLYPWNKSWRNVENVAKADGLMGYEPCLLCGSCPRRYTAQQ